MLSFGDVLDHYSCTCVVLCHVGIDTLVQGAKSIIGRVLGTRPNRLVGDVLNHTDVNRDDFDVENKILDERGKEKKKKRGKEKDRCY